MLLLTGKATGVATGTTVVMGNSPLLGVLISIERFPEG